MNSIEWRAAGSLSVIYILRMLGMFMIMPVLAVFARDLNGGATAVQIGLAIGIYGLAQAGLQIPFGMLSDRIGRKPVIFFGMVMFAIGSFVAAQANTIEMIIFGRALQGMGAVSAAVSALLADVTREQVRSTAMAILGIGMGLSFISALALGPVIAGKWGLSGIFLLTGVLALFSLPILIWVTPSAEQKKPVAGGLKRVFANRQLLRLDAGIFVLHALFTGLFVVLPVLLESSVPRAMHWKVYLPLMILSLIPVFPLLRRFEARNASRTLMLIATALLIASTLTMAASHGSKVFLMGGLLVLFVGFNLLEALLPSTISKQAPAEDKGAALGVYSSSQFLGSFVGGLGGGLLLHHVNPSAVFIAGAILASGIFFLFLGLRHPKITVA